MLAADVVKDFGITVMLPGNTDAEALAAQFQPLVDRCMHEVLAEGVGPENIVIQQSLDMRYRGQSYELNIALSPDYQKAFEAAHARAYGYHRPDVATEIVNLRVRAIGRIAKPPLIPGYAPQGESQPVLLETRQVKFDRQLNVPFYRGENLQPGNLLQGPAIIVRNDTTVLLNTGDSAVIDASRNIIIAVLTDGSNKAIS
jgi:N-methylhydantoinase A